MAFFFLRRARLRPEYAQLYPFLVPYLWLGARSTARAVRRRDASARQRELNGERILPDAHFEFRGGRQLGSLRATLGTRITDRLAASVDSVKKPSLPRRDWGAAL
jgi:hypothetical protein